MWVQLEGCQRDLALLVDFVVGCRKGLRQRALLQEFLRTDWDLLVAKVLRMDSVVLLVLLRRDLGLWVVVVLRMDSLVQEMEHRMEQVLDFQRGLAEQVGSENRVGSGFGQTAVQKDSLEVVVMGPRTDSVSVPRLKVVQKIHHLLSVLALRMQELQLELQKGLVFVLRPTAVQIPRHFPVVLELQMLELALRTDLAFALKLTVVRKPLVEELLRTD